MTIDNNVRDIVFTSCGDIYDILHNADMDEETKDEIAQLTDKIESAVGAPDRHLDEDEGEDI